MKSSSLSVGLFALTTLSALIALPIARVDAQCVMNDTNIQMSINGSGKPTKRSNDVTQTDNGPCVGNTVNTTNVQLDTGGTRRATQNRRSSQEVNGTQNSPTGINLAPIKTHQNIQIDIDNPADRVKR
jgi:hypothetical protein